jgi:hypothetical protein
MIINKEKFNYENETLRVYTVAYRFVAKRRLSKQWPSLGSARNNRTTVLCNPFSTHRLTRLFINRVTVENGVSYSVCVNYLQRREFG